MPSTRDTYNTTVRNAALTQVATSVTNEITRQTTIDAAKSAVGYTLQTGTYSTFAAAVANANKAAVAAAILAEHNKQVAISNARDLLRDSGDKAPA